MARLLHISDWHVGATLYRCERAQDHAAVLAETVRHAEKHRPDLVLHTGDVFEALMPSPRAMAQAIGTLQALGGVAPVIVLAGNHDNPRLFEVFAQLVGTDARITFVPKVKSPSDGGIVEVVTKSDERIRVAPVPFIHQNRFVDWFADEVGVNATYADRVRRINAALGAALATDYDPTRDVLVYAAHLHVDGAILGGSERTVHVTEQYATGSDAIPQVSYAALGHIHRPQVLPGRNDAAYAGSALPLDFAERDEAKSIVLVDVEPGRPPELTRLPLATGRRLRLLRGDLGEVEAAAQGVGDAIVKVIVESEDPTPGLVDRVRTLMPDATVVEIIEQAASRRLTPAHEQDASERELTLDELFARYLESSGSPTVPAAHVQAAWSAVNAALDAEDELDLPALKELMAAEIPTPEEPIADGSVT